MTSGRNGSSGSAIASRDTAGKTYIAALGAALLAKATEPGVDSLTQRQEAGPPVPLADVPPRLAAWAAAR